MNERSRLGRDIDVPEGRVHTRDYLTAIGVPDIARATAPFDPGYDPFTFEGHLVQSSHLMAQMKISMATWQVCDEDVARWKVAACASYGVPTVTGGGPFEIAVQQGQLPLYLDLVADMGVGRIEAGEGFTDMPLPPKEVMRLAEDAASRCSSSSARSTTAPSPAMSSRASSSRAGIGSTPVRSRSSSRRGRALWASGCFDAEGGSTPVSRIGSSKRSDWRRACSRPRTNRANSRC